MQKKIENNISKKHTKKGKNARKKNVTVFFVEFSRMSFLLALESINNGLRNVFVSFFRIFSYFCVFVSYFLTFCFLRAPLNGLYLFFYICGAANEFEEKGRSDVV